MITGEGVGEKAASMGVSSVFLVTRGDMVPSCPRQVVQQECGYCLFHSSMLSSTDCPLPGRGIIRPFINPAIIKSE